MQSLLSYYTNNHFNPVPIDIDDRTNWTNHFAKRQNLYEHHLRIPFGLLEGRDAIEFGCNSGENALVLAAAGMNLTLVEPNAQSIPRLKSLFETFGLGDRITALHNLSVNDFKSDQSYDLVIAEGFLNTLPNRDAMLSKLSALARPGGIISLSFDDRYGGLIEQVKRFVQWRACGLLGIDDIFSAASKDICKKLYLEDFQTLNASRPFHAWWMDQIVNPFALDLWTYDEILSALEAAGCRLYGTSPVWANCDRYTWYKDVPEDMSWQGRFRPAWCTQLPFILTGKPVEDTGGTTLVAMAGILQGLDELLAGIANYSRNFPTEKPLPVLPNTLLDYLAAQSDTEVQSLGNNLKRVFDPNFSGDGADFVALYKSQGALRNLWGSAYHYLSCIKIA